LDQKLKFIKILFAVLSSIFTKDAFAFIGANVTEINILVAGLFFMAPIILAVYLVKYKLITTFIILLCVSVLFINRKWVDQDLGLMYVWLSPYFILIFIGLCKLLLSGKK